MGMEYLYIYSAASEFIEDYYGEEYHEPWVSVTIETEEVNYNKKGRDRLLVTPLTFKTLVDGECGDRIIIRRNMRIIILHELLEILCKFREKRLHPFRFIKTGSVTDGI